MQGHVHANFLGSGKTVYEAVVAGHWRREPDSNAGTRLQHSVTRLSSYSQTSRPDS
jgi:hypothetical protein